MSVSMIPSIVRVRARGEDEINKYQTILTTKSFVLTHSISRLLLLWLLILSIVIHTSLSSDFMFRSLNLNTMNTAFLSTSKKFKHDFLEYKPNLDLMASDQDLHSEQPLEFHTKAFLASFPLVRTALL